MLVRGEFAGTTHGAIHVSEARHGWHASRATTCSRLQRCGAPHDGGTDCALQCCCGVLHMLLSVERPKPVAVERPKPVAVVGPAWQFSNRLVRLDFTFFSKSSPCFFKGNLGDPAEARHEGSGARSSAVCVTGTGAGVEHFLACGLVRLHPFW